MAQPFWKLVFDVALKLTAEGKAPFTRKDLIAGVQATDPTIGPGTINPIIQGMTANLQGGPGGTASRNLLFSVGRGLFVVNGGRSMPNPSEISAPRAVRAVQRVPIRGELGQSDGAIREIGGHAFRYVTELVPKTDIHGRPIECLPHDRYENVGELPLNKYGRGPFCSFRIPRNLNSAGVYSFVVDEEVAYIGECTNLSQSFNTGYGNISPRNCYVGGQETNCRINSLVLSAVKRRSKIGLWFYSTPDYKAIERQLRMILRPAWNRI